VAEAHDREFFLSVFLMEAWDTLGAVEDGLTAFMLSAEDSSPSTLEQMVVVTHRLRGAAALNGFPQVAALAALMEERVAGLAGQDGEQRGRSLQTLGELAAGLKRALDGIGDSGEEDAEALSELLNSHLTRVAPALVEGEELEQRLAALDAFFADNPDVVEYFVPEATEHLELMSQSLLTLERDGPSADELARLFRAVHTLKGAAYTVGCPVIGDLAHRVEDLMGEVREDRRAVAPAVIEALEVGLETLRLLVRSAHAASPERPEAVARLVTVLEALGPAAERAPASAASSVPAPPAPAAEPLESAPDAVAASPAPVILPLLVGGVAEPSRPASTPGVRPSIRVNLDRLDALMNLVGELIVARSRLERRLGQFDLVGDLLGITEVRLNQAVEEFERKYLEPRMREAIGSGDSSAGPPPVRPTPAQGPLTSAGADLTVFGELEFDRYDDFNILARRVGELASDVAEIQGQLAGLVRAVREDSGRVHQLGTELRGEVTRARMVPVARLFARCSRQVREAGRAAGKRVTLDTSGEAVEMDNTVVEQISDSLTHLIQNAVVHGIEDEEERQRLGKPAQGTLRLAASHRGSVIIIEIADDGRGIDIEAVKAAALRGGFVTEAALGEMSARDILDLIFLPGFSTAEAVTTAAGRGVGMDVVRTNVARLGGDLEVETTPGQGTRFTIRLPLTVAVSDALLVRLGAEMLAIAVPAVKAMVRVQAEDIRHVGGRETVEIEGQPVELLRLEHVLQIPSQHPGGPRPVVAIRTGRRSLAVTVDELLGKEDVVIRPLGAFLEGVGPYGGATVSAEGRVILFLDPVRLLEGASGLEPARPIVTAPVSRPSPRARRRVLLVDDSVSVRKFVGQMLERAGFAVVTANDGAAALQCLADESFEVIVTDLEMPRLNGYELLRDLRRRPATRQTPVVVLTTRAGEKHVNLARQLGVQHYMAKPVDEQAFVRLVDSLATPLAAGVAV
jgi:chemosensory pili system protein ChpA (sensor histidine kinase/response regulator)